MLCCGCNIAFADTLKFDETLLCTFVPCSAFCISNAMINSGNTICEKNNLDCDDNISHKQNIESRGKCCRTNEQTDQPESYGTIYNSYQRSIPQDCKEWDTSFSSNRKRETRMKLPLQLFRIVAILVGNDHIINKPNHNENPQQTMKLITTQSRKYYHSPATRFQVQHEPLRAQSFSLQRTPNVATESLKRKRTSDSQQTQTNYSKSSQSKKDIENELHRNVSQRAQEDASALLDRSIGERKPQQTPYRFNAGKQFQLIFKTVYDYYISSLEGGYNFANQYMENGKTEISGKFKQQRMNNQHDTIHIDEEYLIDLCKHFGYNESESRIIIDEAMQYDINSELLRERKKEAVFEQQLFSTNKLMQQIIFPEQYRKSSNDSDPAIEASNKSAQQSSQHPRQRNLISSLSSKKEAITPLFSSALNQDGNLVYESFYRYYYLHKNVIHSEIIDSAKRGLIYLFPETEFSQSIQQPSMFAGYSNKAFDKNNILATSSSTLCNGSNQVVRCASSHPMKFEMYPCQIKSEIIEKSQQNHNCHGGDMARAVCALCQQQFFAQGENKSPTILLAKNHDNTGNLTRESCKSESRNDDISRIDSSDMPTCSPPIGLIKSEPLIRFISLLRAASVVDEEVERQKEDIGNFVFQSKAYLSNHDREIINDMVKSMKSERGEELYLYGVNGDEPLFKRMNIDNSQKVIVKFY